MAPQNLTLNHQFSENHKIGVPTSLETLISTKDISLSLFWMIFWIILVQIFPKRVRFYPILINFGYNQAIFTYQAGGSPEVVESEESERLDETLRLRSEIVRIKAQGAALGFPGGRIAWRITTYKTVCKWVYILQNYSYNHRYHPSHVENGSQMGFTVTQFYYVLYGIIWDNMG